MAKGHWSPCQIQTATEMAGSTAPPGIEQLRKAKLDHLLHANPPLALGHQLKEWFHEIVEQGDLEALEAWGHEASRSGLKQFKAVARSFRQDYDAIKMALTKPMEHRTMRRANLPGEIDQADGVWPGQAEPVASANIAPVCRITSTPWHFHSLRPILIPFTKNAEEPNNGFHLKEVELLTGGVVPSIVIGGQRLG